MGEGFVEEEEVALGLGLVGLPCCLLAELGTFYFIFSVGGDWGGDRCRPGE